jgi:pimeloyl-ACP methyl ester carboxylesterase
MMLELAENVEHEEIKGAGHWMPEEAPEEFVRVISSWVKRLNL